MCVLPRPVLLTLATGSCSHDSLRYFVLSVPPRPALLATAAEKANLPSVTTPLAAELERTRAELSAARNDSEATRELLGRLRTEIEQLEQYEKVPRRIDTI